MFISQYDLEKKLGGKVASKTIAEINEYSSDL